MDDCNEILAKDVTGYLGTPPRACPPKVAKRRVGLQLSDTGVNKKTGPLKMTKRTHFKQHHMLQPERLTPKWDGSENRRKQAFSRHSREAIGHMTLAKFGPVVYLSVDQVNVSGLFRNIPIDAVYSTSNTAYTAGPDLSGD
jgi:hypothetical protein